MNLALLGLLPPTSCVDWHRYGVDTRWDGEEGRSVCRFGVGIWFLCRYFGKRRCCRGTRVRCLNQLITNVCHDHLPGSLSLLNPAGLGSRSLSKGCRPSRRRRNEAGMYMKIYNIKN